MTDRSRRGSGGLTRAGVCAALAALLLGARSSPACAEEPSTDEVSDDAPSPEAADPGEPSPEAADPDALRWKPEWRRPMWADYVATVTLMAGATVELLLPTGGDAKRSGGILLDDVVRDGFVLGSDKNRNTMGTFADVSLATLAAYPPVIDAGVVALGVRGSPEVAWNLLVIDAQAFAFTSLTTGLVKRIVDRERPVGTECRANPSYDDSCDGADNHLSFPSGHTSIAFTGASLTCLHHSELELYGGAGDTLACVGALTLATLTGTARIAADKHYLSDVVSGAVIGIVSGAGMPWLFYYYGRDDTKGPTHLGPTARSTILPVATDEELGAAWVGSF
jgi:membrane-associated phospholipid phosphatase